MAGTSWWACWCWPPGSRWRLCRLPGPTCCAGDFPATGVLRALALVWWHANERHWQDAAAGASKTRTARSAGGRPRPDETRLMLKREDPDLYADGGDDTR